MPRRRARRGDQSPADDAQPSSPSGPQASLPVSVVSSSDAAWARLHGLLNGLLSLEVDARFHHEPHHASASWLALHVTRVENASSSRKDALPTRIGEVMGALATLCAAAERVRLLETDQLAFWTRVLSSQMMARPLDRGDVAIWWFAQHVRERQLRVKLQWSERKLERAMLVPVKQFLDADWAAFDVLDVGDRTALLREMKVAICVTKTQLTAKDVELLGSVLRRAEPGATQQGRRLFEDAISSLEISETVLTTDSLRALASRVYPTARRIDELRLEAIFPSGPLGDANAVLTPEFAAAFKSVLAAALDASHCKESPRAVGISLAYNNLHVVHLQALYDSLRRASRDLRSLSLKYALGSAQSWTPRLVPGLLKALEAIVFTTSNPSGHIDNDCELDLTGRTLEREEMDIFVSSLADRATKYVPAVRQALARRKVVTCRVGDPRLLLPWDEEDTWIDSHRDYVVRSVTEAGEFEILVAATEQADEVAGSIPVREINEISVDGEPLFRCRFNRLVLDGDVEGRFLVDDARPARGADYRSSLMDVCGCEYSQLLEAFGPRISFLSMRWYRCRSRHSPDLMVLSCPRVKHLNVEGSSPFVSVDANWLGLVNLLSELETLNLTSTQMKPWIANAFIRELVQAARLPLKRLSIAQNLISAENVQQLEFLLDVAQDLHLLEVNSIGHSTEVEAYINARRDLTRNYQGAVVDSRPMGLRSKLAFLSVATKFCGRTALEPSVAGSIISMAEQATVRQILWHGSKS